MSKSTTLRAFINLKYSIVKTSPTFESEIRGEAASEIACRMEEYDINWLINKIPEYQKASCPGCGADKTRYRFSKHKHKFDECMACGTVFLNPRPSPDLLQEYYKISKSYAYWSDVVYPASEAARLKRIVIPRVDRILEIARRNKSTKQGILDIGAGSGTFCAEIKKRAAFQNVYALEPSPSLAESCRSKGIQTVDKPIEFADLSDIHIDMAVAFEVIEHLNNPMEMIKGASRVLSDDGLLVLTCPNVKGFDISMLQEKSSSVDPRHLNLFNPDSLTHLLDLCGFDTVETLTPGILDAELVRKGVINGDIPEPETPFLKQVLIEDWERLGKVFQEFLSINNLSSHLWIVAKKKTKLPSF